MATPENIGHQHTQQDESTSEDEPSNPSHFNQTVVSVVSANANDPDESEAYVKTASSSVPSSPELYFRTSQRDHLFREAFDYRFGCNNRLQDMYKAYSLFEQSACLGNADALAAVAQMQILGTGVERRLNEARLNLRRAIWHGSVDALEIRALCSMDGTFDGCRDYTNCLQLLSNGVSNNSAACLLWTGFCFEIGLGVPIEWNTAVHAYSAAARPNTLWALLQVGLPGAFTAGDPWILLKMGVHLLNGRVNGRPEGEEGRDIALQCFRKAAALGLADAQVYLAIVLCRGNCEPADIKEAKRWLTDASNNVATAAHPIAVGLLARLQENERLATPRDGNTGGPGDTS